MSIATQIERLQNIKSAIRNALANKGISASTHNMADFADDIANIETKTIHTDTYYAHDDEDLFDMGTEHDYRYFNADYTNQLNYDKGLAEAYDHALNVTVQEDNYERMDEGNIYKVTSACHVISDEVFDNIIEASDDGTPVRGGVRNIANESFLINRSRHDQIFYPMPEGVNIGAGMRNIGSEGVLIDKMPEQLYPSNVEPPRLNHTLAYVNGYGYAIESFYTINLASSNEYKLYKDTFYNAPSDAVAIKSYTSVVPTKAGTAFNSGFVKMTTSGFAVSDIINITQPLGSFMGDAAAGSTKTFSVSKLPRYVFCFYNNRATNYHAYVVLYDVEANASYSLQYEIGSSYTEESITGLPAKFIYSVTSSKVTIKNTFGSTAVRLFAIAY